MKRSIEFGKLFFSLFLLLILSVSALAQSSYDSEVSLNIDDYKITQFISSKGYSPKSVIYADNNGKILLACKTRKTLDQLKEMGIEITRSQILLLSTFRLVKKYADTLETAFPILVPNEIQALKTKLNAITPGIVDKLEDDVRRLIVELDDQGLKKNSYSLLFSYILDGLIWNHFAEANLASDLTISADQPIWAGDIWAVSPKRETSCGTNSYSEKPIYLSVNWSNTSLDFIRPLIGNSPGIHDLLKEYNAFGMVKNKDLLNQFNVFGLVDTHGSFSVPLIEEKDDNPIYNISQKISKNLAKLFLESFNLAAFMKEQKIGSQSLALTIAYHEIMWNIIDEFEKRGLVKKPPILFNPEIATQNDFGDIVFVVVK